MVTSRDVAHLAGVSQATVSRVLQGSTQVKASTRKRVERALSELGYIPNAVARAMKTRRTGTIGVVVARITNPFYPELLEALNRELSKVGRRMTLWDSEGSGEAGAVDAIQQGLVDGVVFTTITGESTSLRAAIARQAPVVLVNRGLAGVECDQVLSDNVDGARQIADYFIRSGHTSVGLIGGPLAASTAAEREDGFRAGLAAYGIKLPPELIANGDFSHDRGYWGVRRLLELANPPTAVFCVNDLTAFGALDGARAAGVRVPEDLWIVGYDDIAMASWESLDLTTVRQPIADMAQQAISRLLQRLGDPTLPFECQRSPNQLIIRGSTGNTPWNGAPQEPREAVPATPRGAG